MARLAALLAALAVAGAARAEAPVPALTGPVVDRAGILSGADVARLEQLARGGKQANGGAGPQLQYLVVRSLEGEALESYSMRVAEAWKLGNAGRDDGVLVVVAVEDRAVRIEVGGGIEGGLTDAQSARIIRNTITPAFREGRYGAGLHDAGVQILSALGALPAGVAQPAPAAGRERPEFQLVALLVVIVLGAVLRGLFGFGRRRRGLLGWAGLLLGSGGFHDRGGGFGGGGGGGWSGGGGGFSGGGASGRW